MAGLFDTFTIAKRGLNVQQGNINTSAHNIANASTPGFSRQRAVIETTRPFGGTSKFDSCIAGQIGTGAKITTIQRIRNEFIDFQYREQNSILGTATSQQSYLSKVQDIIGETSDTGLQGLMSKFYNSLQSLSSASEKTDVKAVVLQNALTLSDTLNYTYNQLEKQLNNAQDELKTYVLEINGYLDQINDLNAQIRRITALGQSPNDLMDSRDLLLDELSSKFGINIDKQKLNAIDLNSPEYDNLNLVNADPNDTSFNRFSTVKSAEVVNAGTEANPEYQLKLQYNKLGDESVEAVEVTIKGEKDELQKLADEFNQCRIIIGDKEGNLVVGNTTLVDGSTYELNTSDDLVNLEKTIFNTYKNKPGINNVSPLNDKVMGEIAGNQSVQDNIKYYMNQLDKIAASLAYTMNAIQTGSVNDQNTVSDNLIFIVKGTNSDNAISAKNITVNKELIDDPTKLNCKPGDTSGNGANDRAIAMASLNTLKMDFASIPDDSSEWTRESFLNSAGV
ncbi:MAG: flagellar hook-associated protein FlgK, partial [Clostridium sp.]